MYRVYDLSIGVQWGLMGIDAADRLAQDIRARGGVALIESAGTAV